MHPLFFLLFWFGAVPIATARLALTFTRERVFETPRAYLEDYLSPDGVLYYFVGCPVCQSYWIAAILALLTFWLDAGDILPWTGPGLLFALSEFVCWAAAVHLAVEVWILPFEPRE